MDSEEYNQRLDHLLNGGKPGIFKCDKKQNWARSNLKRFVAQLQTRTSGQIWKLYQKVPLTVLGVTEEVLQIVPKKEEVQFVAEFARYPEPRDRNQAVIFQRSAIPSRETLNANILKMIQQN